MSFFFVLYCTAFTWHIFLEPQGHAPLDSLKCIFSEERKKTFPRKGVLDKH